MYIYINFRVWSILYEITTFSHVLQNLTENIFNFKMFMTITILQWNRYCSINHLNENHSLSFYTMMYIYILFNMQKFKIISALFQLFEIQCNKKSIRHSWRINHNTLNWLWEFIICRKHKVELTITAFNAVIICFWKFQHIIK